MKTSTKNQFEEMGRRIRERRLQLKMKQCELAERIGFSNNHISSIERGIERPSLETFILICEALNVTPDYLLLGSMKSNNVPRNIMDNLRLCSSEYVEMLYEISKIMVQNSRKKAMSDGSSGKVNPHSRNNG